MHCISVKMILIYPYAILLSKIVGLNVSWTIYHKISVFICDISLELPLTRQPLFYHSSFPSLVHVR